jgi:hypothetical protein
MKLRLILLAGLALGAVPAFGDNTATITVTGSVGNACHMGTPASSTISLGALAAQSDGTLASITAPTTTINGSWCNTGSVIGVIATPLVAQSATGTPPTGFTKAVNYTASASGWTATPASFTTTGDVSGSGNSTTPGTQTATAPDAQTITVNLSNFLTPAAGERLVADANYSGTITVTLAVSP